MKIIKPSYEILTPISDGGIGELKRIEQAARICYESEHRITKFHRKNPSFSYGDISDRNQ